jgi:hypothetical protein
MGFMDWLFGASAQMAPIQMSADLQNMMMNTGMQMQSQMNQMYQQDMRSALGMDMMGQMCMPLGHPGTGMYGSAAWAQGLGGQYRQSRAPSPPRPIMIICKYCSRTYKITEAPDSCKGCGAPVERYSE